MNAQAASKQIEGKAEPRYETIKRYLLAQIEQGELAPGAKVGSENQLSEQFSVSRMTARRALDELSDQGLLFRSQGIGTFVADARPMTSMLEIRNIADEVRQRGHQFTSVVVLLETAGASEDQAHWLGLSWPTSVFHSVLVYFENGSAIQYEDRVVNPSLIPNYLEQDFSVITPHEYLSQVAPLTEADHIVEATNLGLAAERKIAKHLGIRSNQACLKVTRRTYSKRGIVSMASLVHPGDRYRLGGHLQFNQIS